MVGIKTATFSNRTTGTEAETYAYDRVLAATMSYTTRAPAVLDSTYVVYFRYQQRDSSCCMDQQACLPYTTRGPCNHSSRSAPTDKQMDTLQVRSAWYCLLLL